MSFPVARAVSAISVLGLLVASSATVFAADAQIRARITELRVNPAENAKAVVKLGKGREVSVLGKSGDGQWVKISTQLERADDLIKFEGWVDASAVTGDAIASAPTAKSNAKSNAKAEPASSNADLSWVTEEPAASAASDVAAGDNSWDNTPAPAAKPAASASSSDSWGSDTSTPAPAASSSAGEDWGTDSSSSGSSSSGSTDGW